MLKSWDGEQTNSSLYNSQSSFKGIEIQMSPLNERSTKVTLPKGMHMA